ncbi:MAG: 3-hydroxy-5-phosphonooxypentane-2,4-dione thiolase LsrF, partial [Fibrobacteres bacterium]|nr:3-hydroxy-5-phosphonooxypentane-2,4-dione thiolase LsrF [Fibrobacterota bacterium]
VLNKAYDSISSGARGIIFGRNIFMSKHPERLIDALNAVINEGVKPEKAVKEFKL